MFNNRLHLFVKGALSNSIFVKSTRDGTNWTGWTTFPEGGTDVGLGATAFNNRLFLFAKGDVSRRVWVNATR